MKILLLTENWAPRVGGIERYLTGLVNELDQQGHQVTVVAPYGYKSEARSKNYESSKEIKVIRKKFFWTFLKPKWLPLLWFLINLQKKEKFEVILCGKALFEGLAALQLKKKTGVEYIVFSYAMEIEAWIKSSREKKKLKQVIKGAKKVICINEATGQKIKALGGDEKKLVKITPALENDWLAVASDDYIKEIRVKNDLHHPYIFCVARLIKRKGIDDLIRAFGKLDQVRFEDRQLVIVGEGPERQALLHLIEQEWLQTSVVLLGGVPDKDLKALYRGAEFFAMTPKDIAGATEGFGMVYIEAAAQGRPALGTRGSGTVEAVLDGETGILVKEGDIPAMARVIEKLLVDRELRDRLGAAARRRVEREFRWTTRVRELLA